MDPEIKDLILIRLVHGQERFSENTEIEINN
jgi:hypothetical protein